MTRELLIGDPSLVGLVPYFQVHQRTPKHNISLSKNYVKIYKKYNVFFYTSFEVQRCQLQLLANVGESTNVYQQVRNNKSQVFRIFSKKCGVTLHRQRNCRFFALMHIHIILIICSGQKNIGGILILALPCATDLLHRDSEWTKFFKFLFFITAKKTECRCDL